MKVEHIKYGDESDSLRGALVYDDSVKGPRPLLVVAPNWLGVDEKAIRRAANMAGPDFVAFVADMYGMGRTSGGPPEAAELANAVRERPDLRRRRIGAALAALEYEAGVRGIGDASRKAAIGFCFGGGNVLELARDGADVRAVVSLHGDLTTKGQLARRGGIKARVLVLHGAADPVAGKADRDAFEAEMTAAEADWQMLVFGGVLHSFTEDDANVPGVAMYHPEAERQSLRVLRQFIFDAFAQGPD